MGRFWSLLFLLVPLAGVSAFVAAPYYGHWMPEDVSELGHQVDELWTFILWLTGAVFVCTELVLFRFLWRYDGGRAEGPAKFTHGNHSLEIVWTLLPAATLLFISIFQMNAWAEAKMDRPDIPPLVQVTARQFEWRIRYPGEDGVLGTQDDLFTVNDLHVPVDEEILLELKSMDVLHSFFLPNMRVKQDALPGSKIPVWFRPLKTGKYDLVCAELCGWGHYKMKGRLTVKSREDFEAFLRELKKEQEATQ